MNAIQCYILTLLALVTPFSLLGMQHSTLSGSAAQSSKNNSTVSIGQARKIAMECAAYQWKRKVDPFEISEDLAARMQERMNAMPPQKNEDNLYAEYMEIYKKVREEYTEAVIAKIKAETAAAPAPCIARHTMAPPACAVAASAHAWDSAAALANEEWKLPKRYVVAAAARLISSPALKVIDDSSADCFFVCTRSLNESYDKSEYTYKLSRDSKMVLIFKKYKEWKEIL